MTVLDGLCQYLENQGVAEYDETGARYNGDQPALFQVVVPPTPGSIIVLSLYPGPDLDGEDSRNGWQEPRLQVRTRAGQDPRVALQLDRDVRDVLHGLGPVVLPDGTYLQDCHSLQSAPLPLGQDATGRWEFSRNYQLSITETE